MILKSEHGADIDLSDIESIEERQANSPNEYHVMFYYRIPKEDEYEVDGLGNKWKIVGKSNLYDRWIYDSREQLQEETRQLLKFKEVINEND